jgi:hypothetical protein
VVPWKFGFRGDPATYGSRGRRRESEEEERRQELENRLKEHEEKLTVDIERQVAAAVNEMAPTQGLPLAQDPSAHFSNCTSAAVPEEQGAIGVQVDIQRYPVDDICRCTRSELHKPFGNIKMKVCLIHAFITSIIDHIYFFEFCGLAFTMLIITN